MPTGRNFHWSLAVIPSVLQRRILDSAGALTQTNYLLQCVSHQKIEWAVKTCVGWMSVQPIYNHYSPRNPDWWSLFWWWEGGLTHNLLLLLLTQTLCNVSGLALHNTRQTNNDLFRAWNTKNRTWSLLGNGYQSVIFLWKYTHSVLVRYLTKNTIVLIHRWLRLADISVISKVFHSQTVTHSCGHKVTLTHTHSPLFEG